jgi:hypothetical protein
MLRIGDKETVRKYQRAAAKFYRSTAARRGGRAAGDVTRRSQRLFE